MVQAALEFNRNTITEVTELFSALNSHIPLTRIQNPEEYDRAVITLKGLLDLGAANENHPLAGLLAIVGGFIGDYDDEHYPIPDASPVEVLQFLMEQNDLRQTDLAAEIGSQGVVSEIMSGKRKLNVKQIAKLAGRFSVPPGLFIEMDAKG